MQEVLKAQKSGLSFSKGIHPHERWLILLENECLDKGFRNYSSSPTH